MVVYSGDGLFGVKNCREVERDSYVDVRRGGCVFANVFEEKFWFCEVEVLALMSSGSGSGTVEPELILRRP